MKFIPRWKWRFPRGVRRRWLRLLKRGRRAGVRMLLTFMTTKSIINSILGIRPAIQNLHTMITTNISTDINRDENKNSNVVDNSRNAIVEAAERVAVSLAAIPDSGFRSTRQVNEIILHCSATKDGQDFSADDIRRWHLERGFNDIGYHFVIRLDGTIEQGRDINLTGAHCLNHNRRSIGVCYIGGLDRAGRPADTRTPAQRLALPALLRRLRHHHPTATIHGHREFAAKACPCFNAAEYASLPAG